MEPTWKREQRTPTRGRAGPDGRRAATGSHRLPFFAVALLFFAAACEWNGDAPAADAKAGRGGDTVAEAPASRQDDQPGKAGARKGGDEARAGEARANAGSTGRNTIGEDDPRKLTLEVSGDRDAGFSGACSVGRAKRVLDGRAPERYVFEPRGESVECEVRSEGHGALDVAFTDGAGVRSEQRITAGQSTVRFAYSNGGISSSTFSTSGVRSATRSEGSS